jgi:hypothetical protein
MAVLCCLVAHIHMPWAAIRTGPLQYLEVPAASCRYARPKIHRAPELTDKALQHRQVARKGPART